MTLVAGVRIRRAALADAAAILALQRLAYRSEAQIYSDWSIPPLTQSLDSLLAEFADSIVLAAMAAQSAGLGEHLVGSVRAKAAAGICTIGRLIVHPDFQRRGVGSALLVRIESSFPDVQAYELFTGSRSDGNIRLYRRHGYTVTRRQALSPAVSLVFMRKTPTLAP